MKEKCENERAQSSDENRTGFLHLLLDKSNTYIHPNRCVMSMKKMAHVPDHKAMQNKTARKKESSNTLVTLSIYF